MDNAVFGICRFCPTITFVCPIEEPSGNTSFSKTDTCTIIYSKKMEKDFMQ